MTLRIVLYLALLLMALLSLARKQYVTFSVSLFMALLLALYLARVYFRI